ncbi:MAG: sensor histidine kinase KdpD [Gammaproteobacteria bacterium]
MSNGRPDPDSLLAKIEHEARKARRGHLKIFLGAAAGVGKTFAMLQAAQALHRQGQPLLVGVIETHGRSETAALLMGLDLLPRRRIPYGKVVLEEFDLDAALAKHPPLIMVDELAHSNAAGSRHAKRWQDVEELLTAGIDVYTTLNIQHIESLNDVVTQITGVRVWETVPDTFFEQADDVELVDLPPDELLQRLHEGKVYLPQQAERAIENFFRKGNLIALRELALRRTADRVDVQMREYRESHAIEDVWPARERIMVCIGSGIEGEKLVRSGKRMADSLRAEWLVVYIETPDLLRIPEKQREVVARVLRLTESLGGETLTLNGSRHFSAEVLAFAHARNITRIIMGKPHRRGWKRWIFGSVVDAIVAGSGTIDVHVVSTDDAMKTAQASRASRIANYLGLAHETREFPSLKSRRRGYLWALIAVIACTLVAWAMLSHFALSNLIMVYLLGVVVVAVRYGRGPSILSVILGVMAFDFFFVPPYFTFAVADTQYFVTFTVMLVVGMVISNLTASVRLQARVAAHRERRTAALYAMSRELAATRGQQNLLDITVRHVAEVFDTSAAVLLPDEHGRIHYPESMSSSDSFKGADLSVAQWVHDHGQLAGIGTDTLPGSDALYLPLTGSTGVLGVLAVIPTEMRRVFLPEQRRLLETFCSQVALALERVRLARQAAATQLKMETERLRNSLLSAISHDLRTPLATIVGASSSLLEEADKLTPTERHDLSSDILESAQRMNDLMNNVLDMARLQAGAVKLNRQWYPLEEVVGSVLTRLRDRLKQHQVSVHLPAELPWLSLDGGLIEQVLVNLLENAAKYTPPGTPIEINAAVADGKVTVEVTDRGPGLLAGSEEQVFEKFYRAQLEGPQAGVGLGLTICRAIVEVHGGRIWAENRPEGGARFKFTLSAKDKPPAVEAEVNV